MTGYVRVDTSNNIADGNVISADDLDNEFDGVVAAFNASTGHKHDGTAGEGAAITKIGPVQDVTISTSLMAPKTTNTVDIGSGGLKFKDLFLAGNASITGTLGVTGAITASAGTANGVAYLNGSKVLTTGSALTFNGSNLGLGVTPSASWWASIKSLGVGRLGNGVFGSTSDDEINIGANVINTGSGTYIYGATDTASLYRQVAAQHVWYYSASGTAGAALSLTEAMRITSAGNVGIGTSAALAPLHVAGGTASSTSYDMLVLAAGSSNTIGSGSKLYLSGTPTSPTTRAALIEGVITGATNAHSLLFYTSASGASPSERLRIDSSGNLGLSVTPSAWLGAGYQQFPGNGFIGNSTSYSINTLSSGVNAYFDTSWKYKATGRALRYDQNSSGAHAWHIAPSGTAGNAISFTQAMTLDSSGNLLVATTNAGVGGLGVSNLKNINFPESATTAYATMFRQASSAALTLNYGYAWSATANAWASSIGTSTARSSIRVRGGQINFYTDGASTVAVGTNITPSQRLTIDSNGKLLFAGNSGSAWNAAFNSFGVLQGSAMVIAGQGSLSNYCNTYISIAGSPTAIGSGYCFHYGASASTGEFIVQADSTSRTAGQGVSLSTRFTVSRTGQIVAAGIYNQAVSSGRDVYVNSVGLLGYPSSIRESKTNIEPLDDVQWLLSLDPVKFNHRKRDEEQNFTDEFEEEVEYGLIAEDAEQVNEDLVFHDIVDGEKELRGVHYRKLVPPLLKMVQQQQAIIESLKARLDAANL